MVDIALIDVDGSMAAFNYWRKSKKIPVQAKKLFYFHNIPITYLYRDATRLRYLKIEEVFSAASVADSKLVIFSDAGAARGGYNTARIELTLEFVQCCGDHFGEVVWLNPVPSLRWVGTTAEEIAKVVTMTEWEWWRYEN